MNTEEFFELILRKKPEYGCAIFLVAFWAFILLICV